MLEVISTSLFVMMLILRRIGIHAIEFCGVGINVVY